jgi:hypothetical protein
VPVTGDLVKKLMVEANNKIEKICHYAMWVQVWRYCLSVFFFNHVTYCVLSFLHCFVFSLIIFLFPSLVFLPPLHSPCAPPDHSARVVQRTDRWRAADARLCECEGPDEGKEGEDQRAMHRAFEKLEAGFIYDKEVCMMCLLLRRWWRGMD